MITDLHVNNWPARPASSATAEEELLGNSGWNANISLVTSSCKTCLLRAIRSNSKLNSACASGSSEGSCKDARYGWVSASSTVMRFVGEKVSMRCSKSTATGLAFGYMR